MVGKKSTENDIRLGDLRTLIRASEARSLGAAAQKLGVDRSTVSRRLGRLKSWASGRDMHIGNELTPDGKRLADLLRPMLKKLDAFRSELPQVEPPSTARSGKDIEVP